MSKDPRIKLDWRNPFPHPGTWQQFCIREDNERLNLDERRQKFLKEESLYYKFRGPDPYSNWLGGAGNNGFAGNASDGPIAGATVTCNLGTVVTDSLGNFTYPDTPAGDITVTGGTDAITGVAFTGELKGFPQYKTISPMTTLAYHLKEEDVSLTADTAVDLLFASSSTLFGIELTVADKDVMLNKDYVAESISEDSTTAIAAQSIATYLESVTSMVGSALRGANSAKFTDDNAKVEGYKSISRQINNMRGAKIEIDPQTLFDVVKLPNGADWTVTGSLNRTNRETIKTQLDNVRNQLGTLSRSEAYTANYLTTQIQAINRGVKEDYSLDAKRLAEGTPVTFDSIDDMVGKSTGSLAQIEDGKTNENTRAEGEKPETFYTLGSMTFTQIDSRGDTQTLSGDAFVSGSMKAIAARSSAFTEQDALGKYIIKPNRDSLSLQGATNYSARFGDVTAKQTTVSPENAEANKLIQLTLDGRTLQVTALALVDAPSASAHIFNTGTYTLNMAASRVTQVLEINSSETPNTLSHGAIRDLNIRGGISVVPDLLDSTKFIVTINGVAVTPPGGTAFSGTGDRSTLQFTNAPYEYTIQYSTE